MAFASRPYSMLVYLLACPTMVNMWVRDEKAMQDF